MQCYSYLGGANETHLFMWYFSLSLSLCVCGAADGGPLHGWAQTSGYNAVTSLGSTKKDQTGLLCYDRQGWGGGYYGVGLPPIFGPKGAWPKGRAARQGCYLDVSTTFCVRVEVELAPAALPDNTDH